MIALDSKMCDVLELTYWQLKKDDKIAEQVKIFRLTRDEKELLRKILLAKNIKLVDEMLEVKENTIAVLNLSKLQIIFDDVNKQNTEDIIHLAKLSEMLEDSKLKKLTWYKLKNIDL